MTTPKSAVRWTAARVADELIVEGEPGPRYQVVDGELIVTPSPSKGHQRTVRELGFRLYSYVNAHAIGELFFAPADVRLDEYTLVEPDVLVAPLAAAGADEPRWFTSLLLAVEVLSPGNARHDRLVKRRRYQRAGIECWIVDLDARIVERWAPGDDRPEILSDSLAWQPRPNAPPLEIDLAALFAEVLDR